MDSNVEDQARISFLFCLCNWGLHFLSRLKNCALSISSAPQVTVGRKGHL